MMDDGPLAERAGDDVEQSGIQGCPSAAAGGRGDFRSDEREQRARNLVKAMDKEGFGNCTNQYECEAACPKEIPVRVIGEMNREYLRGKLKEEPASTKRVGGDG